MEENKDNKGVRNDISKGLDVSKYGEFVDVICYNCGVPGHHKAGCKKPRFCFICKKEDHVVDTCPVKKQGHACAKYVGSAANGLGFYLIEIPEKDNQPTIDFTNCGKVYIESGEISKEELQLELATCFNPNWPWQIRQLDEWCFWLGFHQTKKLRIWLISILST